MAKMRSIGKPEIYEDDAFSKFTLTDGQGDEKPNAGSVCVYGIHLLEGLELDESEMGGYKIGQSNEITIGEGDCYLSEHFDKVLLSMKAGEAAYIKSKFDHKGKKIDSDVLNKAQFKFNVHLESFQRAADLAELEGDERLERAQHHKDKGTELFKQDRIEYAMKRYEKALECLGGRGEARKLPGELPLQHKTLILQCHLNLAAGMLKKEDYEGVVKHCTEALDVSRDSVKGLFRRGQAYVKLQKMTEARKDFAAVVELEPNNKAAKREIAVIDDKLKKEKQMYQKMFSSN
jgi:tetratricopeptide (TPR) repeat protein